MAKKYYELSPEALERKNAYIDRYNKTHYKVFSFKLRIDDDVDLINALKENGESVCSLTKKALREYLQNHR